MRLKLVLAYDGAAFSGWQSQAGGGSVQDAVEQAFAGLCGGAVRVHGAGRTDAGVHATGQVAHADVPAGRLDPRRWRDALNAALPRGVRVMACSEAGPGFHARFSAAGKVYLYRLWTGDVQPPHEAGRSWHVRWALDLGRMRECARRFEGRRDFAAFAANRGRAEASTVRVIRSVRVARSGPLVRVRYDGEGFLYRMVRLLTGAMVRVGSGRMDLAEVEAFFERGAAGRKCPYAAPAHGLWLERVRYAGRRSERGGSAQAPTAARAFSARAVLR